MTRAGQAKGLGLLTLVNLAAMSASLVSASRLAGCLECTASWRGPIVVAWLGLCAAVAVVAPAVAWAAWVRGEKPAWLTQLAPLLLAGAGQVAAGWALVA